MAQAAPPSAEMPFLEHLEELRWRIVWSLAALIVGMVVAFALLTKIDIIGVLQEPVRPFLQGRKLVFTSPSDSFKIVLNAALMLGIVLASPVIIYQVWAFLSPALYSHEKRVIVPVLAGGVVLFLAGIALSYFVVLPVTLGFLLSFQTASLEPMITAGEYFSFAISMSLAFGLAFELPIVIVALAALGLVTPTFLNTYRRHAIVLCVIAAAVITPGADPTSLFALAVPLYFLYELSVVLTIWVHRKRLQREARMAAEEAVAASAVEAVIDAPSIAAPPRSPFREPDATPDDEVEAGTPRSLREAPTPTIGRPVPFDQQGTE